MPLGTDILERICTLPYEEVKVAVRELDLSRATEKELALIREVLKFAKLAAHPDVSIEEAAIEMAKRIPGWQDSPELTGRIFELHGEAKVKQREKLWRSKPAEWAIDRLGIRRETLYWSENPGYERHKWDSALVTMVETEDGWEEREAPLPNPLIHFTEAIAGEAKYIVVPAGTALSKSHSAAWLTLWFLEMNPACPDPDNPGDWVTTLVEHRAGGSGEVLDAIWRNIATFWEAFSERHPNAELQQGRSILYLDTSEGFPRKAWSARKKTSARRAGARTAAGGKGGHATNQLIVWDEMQDADRATLRSSINTLSGDNNKLLGLGNPEQFGDPMHDFARTRADIWVAISKLDHPNVVMKEANFIPGAATQEDIDRAFREAAGSQVDPNYMSDVRGRFPTASNRTLFSPDLLEAARAHLLDPAKCEDHVDHGVGITHPHSEGYTTIYRSPTLGSINRYILACDLASDDISGDYHVALVFDRQLDMPVAMIRMRGPRREFAEEVRILAYRYALPNEARGIPFLPTLSWEQVAGHSLAYEDAIKDYPNIYRPTNLDSRRHRRGDRIGWRISKKSRVMAQEALVEWSLRMREKMESGTCPLVIPELHKELGTFVAVKEYEGGGTKYAAAAGSHDDIVLALLQCLYIDKDLDQQGRSLRHAPKRQEVSPEQRRLRQQAIAVKEQRARFMNPLGSLVRPPSHPIGNPLAHLL